MSRIQCWTFVYWDRRLNSRISSIIIIWFWFVFYSKARLHMTFLNRGLNTYLSATIIFWQLWHLLGRTETYFLVLKAGDGRARDALLLLLILWFIDKYIIYAFVRKCKGLHVVQLQILIIFSTASDLHLPVKLLVNQNIRWTCR